MIKNWIWLFFTSIILIFDQVSKTLIRLNWREDEIRELVSFTAEKTVQLLPNGNLQSMSDHSLNLTRLENVAMGGQIASEWGVPAILWVLVGLTAAMFIAWAEKRYSNHHWIGMGTAFVMGGLLGNAVDRLAFGHVTDFLGWKFLPMFWIVGNIADLAIFCGCALVVFKAVHAFLRERNSLGNSMRLN